MSTNKTIYSYFTVIVPPAIKGQKKIKSKIKIPIEIEGKLRLLTPEAHQIIDMRKIQIMLTQLREAVSILDKKIDKLAPKNTRNK